MRPFRKMQTDAIRMTSELRIMSRKTPAEKREHAAADLIDELIEYVITLHERLRDLPSLGEEDNNDVAG